MIGDIEQEKDSEVSKPSCFKCSFPTKRTLQFHTVRRTRLHVMQDIITDSKAIDRAFNYQQKIQVSYIPNENELH